MSKYMTTKKEADVKLEGISVEFTVVDDIVKAVLFEDKNGNKVRMSADYGMYLSVPAPPKMKKVFRLHGTVLGIPFSEDHDTDWIAQNRRSDFIAATRSEDGCKLTIEEVEVPE